MPRFAANLSTMFTELPFPERFRAAADAGFEGVEILRPYTEPAAEIRTWLEAAGLRQVLFNLPPGDWDAGERGIAALPGREGEFRDSVVQALEYAQALGCPRLHMMAGVVPSGADEAECAEVYTRNLMYAADQAARLDRSVLIEPINPVDIPGYFLNTQAQARHFVVAAAADNVRVQLDFYHCQIVEGDLTRALERQFPLLGHVQIAGVPDRHEPDVGEVNYPWLFRRLDDLGYTGWVGCEYKPAGDTLAGLAWGRPWGIGPAGG